MTSEIALAQELATALAAAGVTQAELARRAGVTRAYVGRLLAGAQAAPTPDVVEALAQALSVDAAGRLRLFLAAGLAPPDLAAVAGSAPVARLLALLAAAAPARRDQIERLLDALLDALAPASP
ncbi:MAG: helix-turn-helix transcriptional regulator [Chloroflexi bacterium]|nr:helix-turn-helix transcriptional regulator [Chloroflexota bacterium]